jgi:hypothetical protein
MNPDRPTLDFFGHVTVNTHIFFGLTIMTMTSLTIQSENLYYS